MTKDEMIITKGPIPTDPTITMTTTLESYTCPDCERSLKEVRINVRQ